jgi:D-alanyl-D-alanine dipeptidase
MASPGGGALTTVRLVVFLLFAVALATSAAGAEARHPGFVDASEVVPGLVVEIRYFGDHNFVGRRIDGYEQPICLLTRRAATALAAAQRELAVLGLGLKAFDCYRPLRSVADFVRWGRDVTDQRRKADFYPELDKRLLFREGYVASRSNHSRGSAIDLTLVRLSDGLELDMGSPFDFFGARSWTSDRSIPREAQASRALLSKVMRRAGFFGYPREWWHFTLANEPYPTGYFDFPVR